MALRDNRKNIEYYDKIKDEECIPGIYKYNKKFTNIKFAVRTDCWLNFNDNYSLKNKNYQMYVQVYREL